jgi:hypothetical protein
MKEPTGTPPSRTPAQKFLEQSEWLPVRIVGFVLENFDADHDYHLEGQFEKEMLANLDQVRLIVGVKMDELLTTLWKAQIAGAFTLDELTRLSISLEVMRESAGVAP